MEHFEVGDIVYLKSGSPKLTVERVPDGLLSLVGVTWITDGGKLVVSRNFPPECLTKTEPRRTA